MPVVLVDTDVLIDIQRGHESAVAWFATLDEVPCVGRKLTKRCSQKAPQPLVSWASL